MRFLIHEGQVSCQSLMAKYAWVQFANERNRWHLTDQWSPLTLEELLGEPAEIAMHHTTGSSLVIQVVRFIDGGVITYKKDENKFLHTLNTLSVFKQKLWELGLWTPGEV